MEKLLEAANIAAKIKELTTRPIISIEYNRVHVTFKYFTQQFPQFALRKRENNPMYPYEVSAVIGGVLVYALADYMEYGHYMLGEDDKLW